MTTIGEHAADDALKLTDDQSGVGRPQESCNRLHSEEGMTTAVDISHTAMHEAGHAVVSWAFGVGYIEFIDMRPDGYSDARVSIAGLYPFELLPDLSDCDGRTRRHYSVQAKLQIMVHLAGFAVEGKLDNEPDWLECELNSYMFWEEDGGAFFDTGHDIAQAVRAAKAVYGDTRRALRFLHLISTRTDKALADPNLWRVIKSLAARLEETETRLSDDSFYKFMNDAWPVDGSPYRAMGRKWRQRFDLKRNLKRSTNDEKFLAAMPGTFLHHATKLATRVEDMHVDVFAAENPYSGDSAASAASATRGGSRDRTV